MFVFRMEYHLICFSPHSLRSLRVTLGRSLGTQEDIHDIARKGDLGKRGKRMH